MFISDAQSVWPGVGIGDLLREVRGMVNRGSIARCAIAEQEAYHGSGAARGLSVDRSAKTTTLNIQNNPIA
jgi:hypothetical protein